MKLYKAFIKEELRNRIIVSQSVLLTESELDFLIDGESVEKIDAVGKPYKLYYSDLKMVISFDYKTVE